MPVTADLTTRLRPVTLNTKDWGTIRLLRPIPNRDETPKGVFAALDGTPYEKWILAVSGLSVAAALRGHGTPLARELGRDPKAILRDLRTEVCADQAKCVFYQKNLCLPNPKMPVCFTPSSVTDDLGRDVANRVLQAWVEGRHTVYVVGSESYFG